MKIMHSSLMGLSVFNLFLLLLVFVVPSGSLASQNNPPHFKQKMEDLPAPARFAVSAAVGRARADYHVQSRGETITARNAVQLYVVDFSDKGVLFRKGAVRWGMTLAGWGYGEDVEKAWAVKPRTDKNRVEYERGVLTEWYVNGPMGIQQGFTIARAPNERREGEPLRVDIQTRGGLIPKTNPDKKGLLLVDDRGRAVFQYTGLTVLDADGKELPARVAVAGGTFSIRVDDRGARYPLMIDPVVQQAKLLPSDGSAGEYFGVSIAVDGDTIVVGADSNGSDTGSAYVFTYANGDWSQTAKLLASDGAAGDYFGYSVAIDGDTIVVGADADEFDTGAVYVFTRAGGVWSQAQKLTASNGAVGDYFGATVSIDGDAIVAGADGDESGAGSAYVFTYAGGVWSQAQKLTAPGGAAGDAFGVSAAIDGDVIVIGSPGDADSGADTGSAYVFTYAAGVWGYTTKLTASDPAANKCFGVSVAIDGDTIVVSGDGDTAGGVDSGAAYVFTNSGGWSQTAKLTATDAAALKNFGAMVSIDGDTIVLGAPGDADNGVFSGAAYVFTNSGGWSQTAKLTALDGAAGDRFGCSVSVSGGTVAVGAFYDRDNGFDSGSAAVFGDGYYLSTTVVGSGTVTSSPGDVNCTGTCMNGFPMGASVTLTATPASGYALEGWSDANCPYNGTCTITMSSAKAVTATFVLDGDGDGVGDAAEYAGPNGGDGNYDGYLDSWQPNVATFQDINGAWVTMISGAPLRNVTATCNPSPGDLPAGVTPACGFFGFKITGLVPGGSVALVLVFHNQDASINDYWKYGPTPTNGADHWYRFLDDGTAGATVDHANDGKTYITLRLADGGPGDDDLTANGSITDVGGPAVSAGVGGAPGSSSGGGGGGGGCFVSATE